jgi:ABC-type nitrate/sulfonate/bicarbonate transport system substrate-binding protein
VLTLPPMRRSRGWRPVTARARGLLSVSLVLILLLTGCGGDNQEQAGGGDTGGPPDEPVKIRLAWLTPGGEVFYVMQHLPETAPNLGTWYEVEWHQMAAGQLARSIAGGVVDGGAIASLAFANAVEQGADLVITGEFVEERAPNRPMTWLVPADAGIDSPADLRGKTVATIGAGTFADHLQDYYLRTRGGLEPGKDYQKTDIQFPVMQDALLSGRIAAGPFPPPFLQQTLATGKAKPLFTTLDVQPELVVTLNAFRRDFVEEHREAVEKFVEDWTTVFQWVHDPANRGQVIQATSKATEIPVEVLERYLLTEEDGYRPPNGAINVQALQENWDFFREQGAFRTELKVEDYIIPELAPPPA